ncbi:MAG: fibronectin type III-like domain-contianing protein, partial [Acidobacteriaceae bacterium]
PRAADEIPTSTAAQWPGVNGNSTYSENLNVGYRWYDAHHMQPLFPFGYGLSYTTFKMSDLRVTPAKITGADSKTNVQVDLRVKNTGKREGAEVVQLYVEQPGKNGEPPRQLRAFTKVDLQAGESKSIRLNLNTRSFSVYDPDLRAWKMLTGKYEILVGTSSRDLPLERDVQVTDH